MTRDPPSWTRRQLLGGLTGVGGLAAGAGALTAARLSDEERYSSAMEAGSVGIDVDCRDGGCRVEDGRLAFDVGPLEPGASGSQQFTVTVTDNPVRLWLRTECPPAFDPLGDELEVRLSIDEGCDGEADGRQLFPDVSGDWGSLSEFRDAFGAGGRLDDEADPCLAGGAERCVLLEYRLPTDATVPAEAESDLVVDLYAEQCRHVAESEAESPFPDEACPEPECPECVELGKLEVENDQLDVTTYGFDELESPFDGDGHTYELQVLDVTTKDDGEPVCADVRLRRDGQATVPLCGVDVKAGPTTRTHAVDPPDPRTGELCTEETQAGNGGNATRPAISHLVVSVCADAVEDGGGAQ